MHASSSDAPFRKRTFSFPLYARSLAAVTAASPVLVRALIRPRISRALREQVMLGVTSVNDCRYCNWGHTALALRNGVDLAALRQTLGSGSLSTDSTPDQVAILYARHVASEHGDADPGAEPHAGIRGDQHALSSRCAWYQPARPARGGRLFLRSYAAAVRWKVVPTLFWMKAPGRRRAIAWVAFQPVQ